LEIDRRDMIKPPEKLIMLGSSFGGYWASINLIKHLDLHDAAVILSPHIMRSDLRNALRKEGHEIEYERLGCKYDFETKELYMGKKDIEAGKLYLAGSPIIQDEKRVWTCTATKTNNPYSIESKFNEELEKKFGHIPNWDWPINTSFISGAHVAKEKTYAVVLSGNGDDGAEAIKYVEEMGGHTFAQKLVREEAPRGFFSCEMPDSALATGRVQHYDSLKNIASIINDA